MCFYDTGVEYEATKRHLEDLEQKYGIKIHREKAVKSIPACCKEYGIPWFTKRVSDYMSRLQKHNFQWEDEPYEILIQRYPHCETALKWWCNVYPRNKNGSQSHFNIAHHKLLKEFIMANPPQFKISYKCCHYAKKLVAEHFRKKGGYQMEIVGVRQAENGVRSQAYKNCFVPAGEGNREYAQYRPIWWLTDKDKQEYEEHCDITHSDCYSVYGLKRTGCVGCPFSSRFEDELEIIQKYEPKLYTFCVNVFGPSYEYYRAYRKYKQ